MRKVNRIMMSTVSILLCLVLATSSVVSGTLAKFVTTQNSTAQFTYEKFGVEVGVSVDTAKLGAAGATVTFPDANSPLVKAGKYSVTVDGLKLAPGDDFSNVVRFNVGGTANVRCVVYIDVTFTYDISDFNVKIGETSTNMFPISFNATVPTYEDGEPLTVDCAKGWNSNASNIRKGLFYTGFSGKMDFSTKNGYSVGKVFEVDDPIVFHPRKVASNSASVLDNPDIAINEFGFGFYYPWEKEGDNQYTRYDYDKMSVYLADKSNPTFGVTYTIAVEQIA